MKVIRVADAAIFPDSGKVYIHPEAKMRIQNSKVSLPMPTINFIASITAMSALLHGKNTLAMDIMTISKGTTTGSKSSLRILPWIHAGETVAEGNILDTTHFFLSPEFEFRGTINLRASQRNLTFEGGFRPVMDCFTTARAWTYFTSDINPQQVMIPLEDPLRDIHFQKLGLGIIFANTTNRIYPAFFSPTKSFNDSTMITSLGKIDL